MPSEAAAFEGPADTLTGSETAPSGRRFGLEASLGLDDVLMLRVADGDRQAFQQLVERNIDRVVALASRIAGPRDADDIAQDVFLKIWTGKSPWQPDKASFRAWLFRVVMNRCIDYRRRRPFVALDAVPEAEDEGPSAEQLFDRSEQASRLRQARAKLTEQQRIVIALYYDEGLNARECADVLEIKVNAVESLLKRARGRLRELLAADVAR